MKFLQNKMNVWWILLCANVTGLFWMWYFNAFEWMLKYDVTYLSFAILAAYLLSFLYIGKVVKENHKAYYDDTEKQLEPIWFVSEQLLGLGMLGTVIGFMVMLSNNFTNISLNDTQSVVQLMQNMSVSMGTALITTASGLLASMVLKTKLMFFIGDSK